MEPLPWPVLRHQQFYLLVLCIISENVNSEKNKYYLIIMKNVWPEKLLNGLRHLCGSAHHTLKTFNLISGAFWSSLLSLPSLDGRSLKFHHVGSLNDLRFWKKFPLCYCLRHSNKNHIFYICNELEYTLKNI